LIKFTLGDTNGLDFLVKEKDIPPAQAVLYKCLTSSEVDDFKKVLVKLDSQIPLSVSTLVYDLLNGKNIAFQQFYYMTYLVSNNPRKIFWADYLKDS
jgi:hypothetical protein